MALANVIHNADGTVTDWNVPFNYLDRSHIEVFVNNVDVTDVASAYQASFVDDTTIRVTAVLDSSAVPSGGIIKIGRNTPTTSATTVFADGAVVRAAALNANTNQLLYVAQEVVDLGDSRIGLSDDGTYDLNNARIKNLADPINAQDAVSKNYLETVWLSSADKAKIQSLNLTELAAVATDLANVNIVATNIADVNTVAGDIANVNTLAGISTDVTTLAGFSSADITTVATNVNEVAGVAGISTDVTTVAGISGDVTAVAGINAGDLATVAANDANITTVAGSDANVTTVAANIADINTVAADGTDIDTVAGISADVTAVAGISAAITAVDANASNINTVSANDTNITTTAVNIANINTVSGIGTAIATTAGISADVSSVAAVDTDVTTVAGISADVSSVAAIAADVTLAATNAADISAVAAEVAQVVEVANDLTEATSEIDTVATNIAAVNNVGTNIAAVTNVANSIASVNYFGDTYFISATAPSSPSTGDLWFDESTNTMKVYGDSGWQNAGSSVNGTSERVIYTVGTPSGTYTGSSLNTFPMTYDAGFVDVWMNGVKLAVGDEVTASNGTELVLASDAVAGDVIEAIAYGTFELANFSINAANDVDTTGAGEGDVLSLQGSSYSPLTLSPVATTGAYSDISGTPSLATVATSGQFSDLNGVTVSTSQPSGGSDGDIWLVVS